MTQQSDSPQDPPRPGARKGARKNDLRIAYAVLFTAFGMLGMSFAAVPLYQMFCQVTGFGGTPRITANAPANRGERTLTVRFDTNVGPGLDWTFEPETPQIRLRTGETTTVFYKVTNRSDRESTGLATFNVAPDAFGGWFNKISCFCFTEQTLGPGETMDMPVVFFLDPELEKEETMKHMQSVTLSYTFIATKKKTTPVAAVSQETTPRL